MKSVLWSSNRGSLNPELVAQVRALRGKLSDRELRIEIRRLAGVGRARGDEILRQIFRETATEAEPPPPLKKASVSETGDSVIAESVDPRVHTVDELLKLCKVDLTIWEVERFLVNKWEVAMAEPATTVGGAGKQARLVRGKGGRVHTLWTRGSNEPLHEPLFQVKVWLKRRREADAVDIIKFFQTEVARVVAPRFTTGFKYLAEPTKGLLYEICSPDLHLGKLAWKPETGAHWDSKLAIEADKTATSALVSYVPLDRIARFLLPIGNDFFNVDNSNETTTGGTPQREDGRWQKSFRAGCALMVEKIISLVALAPVDVVIVAGNHDHERCFYLGEYLTAFFRLHPGVKIDNSPATRKYYSWRGVLLGMSHGSEEKLAELPLIMATERPAEWAAATAYKGFQVGHFHRSALQNFNLEDIKGVEVQTLSSLCPPDDWHAKKGFVGSIRRSEGLLFDGEQGLVAKYYYNSK